MAMQKGLGMHPTSPCNIAVWFFVLSISILLAAKVACADSEKRVYIVFTDQPIGQDLRDYAIQILSSVLGSRKAAEEALGYVYKHVGPGFSARLTPEQATQLQFQPGVVYVKESEVYELDPGGAAYS